MTKFDLNESEIMSEVEEEEKIKQLEHQVTLQDNLFTIIDDELSKDVTFLVGPLGKKVFAHKAILASRK